MNKKVSLLFFTVLLVYIIVVAQVVRLNIYQSEMLSFMIYVGLTVSITFFVLVFSLMSLENKSDEQTEVESVTVEPEEEPEDEVVEVGILEEFKEDSEEDKKP